MNSKRPVIMMLMGVRLRLYARAQGKKRSEINEMMEGFNNGTVSLAAMQANLQIPDWGSEDVDYSLGSMTEAELAQIVTEDKTLIQRLLDWLKSEQGQQFIKFLFSLLMSLLVI